MRLTICIALKSRLAYSLMLCFKLSWGLEIEQLLKKQLCYNFL